MTYISECEACGHTEKGNSRKAADRKIEEHRQAGCNAKDAWTKAEDRIASLRWALEEACRYADLAGSSLEAFAPGQELTLGNLDHILTKLVELKKNAERVDKDFSRLPMP